MTTGTLDADTRRALHDDTLVFDGSIALELTTSHLDRMRDGGVTAVNHTVTVPYVDTAEALSQINACRRWIDANADRVTLAVTTADIVAAKKSGREAIVFGPQDTEMIGANFDLIGTFYDLGVRILQLTYQRQNLLGSGCGERDDAGLTAMGHTFVGLLNDHRILVDVSHCGERTGRDAMEASSSPVVVTHAPCHALSPHMRAKSDAFIRAMADQGGVMGITGISPFLHYPDEPGRRPDVKRLVAHVAHVAELAGVDAVAIATDFEETLGLAGYDELVRRGVLGPWTFEERRAEGLEDGSKFFNVTDGLADAGFSPEEIRKILGGNWMRMFGQVCDS